MCPVKVLLGEMLIVNVKAASAVGRATKLHMDDGLATGATYHMAHVPHLVYP